MKCRRGKHSSKTSRKHDQLHQTHRPEPCALISIRGRHASVVHTALDAAQEDVTQHNDRFSLVPKLCSNRGIEALNELYQRNDGHTRHAHVQQRQNDADRGTTCLHSGSCCVMGGGCRDENRMDERKLQHHATVRHVRDPRLAHLVVVLCVIVAGGGKRWCRRNDLRLMLGQDVNRSLGATDLHNHEEECGRGEKRVKSRGGRVHYNVEDGRLQR
ncbi:hypothetical protein H310_01608 [Aphanomyces invadans]|uniref:Uncharacterized protein n=1 Tax=Aphanomyces invadans TaxID=157072 RepID=A0A024UTD0_9STRA|nr:hypothetical protein H310_01608 [Aphanomyces invadans]ETW09182.1 hypothetical protein H310_01608 [Aphanomyces invadans]|eukprot:XP_008862987.1 hypothetical protein H310_01608 [Aphanomyces invadans]